jgi:hypothetical protein
MYQAFVTSEAAAVDRLFHVPAALLLGKEKRLKHNEEVGFEVFTAITMKNAVFWDVAPCSSFVNRRFGGMYRLHLPGREIRERGTSVSRWLQPPEDGGDTFLRNIGSHVIYTAPHSRRLFSSHNEELHKLYSPLNTVTMFYSGRREYQDM